MNTDQNSVNLNCFHCFIIDGFISAFCCCRAQQKLSDMKQESQVMKESVWKDDKEVPQCQICLAAFSVARRKVCHTSFNVLH